MFARLIASANAFLIALTAMSALAQGLDLNAPSAKMRLLPPVEHSVLTHAGGAIEVEIPSDWKVYEWSVDRHVHAVAVPSTGAVPTAYRRDGLWFTHTVLPQGRAWENFDLGKEIERRLSTREGKPVVVQRMEPTTVGPWEAESVVYSLSELDHAKGTDQPDEEIVGALTLVRTAWGVVEINGVAPRHLYDQRQGAYDLILRSLKLESPSLPAAPPGGRQELLGSWKSKQAKVRIHGDGKFEILLDSPMALQVHPTPPPENRPVIRRVAGRYTTDDDLLRVTFLDETKANYRWRLDGHELLLTDHEGRVSQLVRIYE